MRYQRLFTLILLLLFAFDAKAAVFTVTSNADSGPGTLREAILLARAVNEVVTINFNLPDQSEAGRTIIILTDLPRLKSNLIIDGSTQPGDKIGISDAKVILKTDNSLGSITVFSGLGIRGLEIYGFYFLDEQSVCYGGSNNLIRNALVFNTSSITFGAKGKGNVINGFGNNAINMENVDDTDIAGNWFGQSPYNVSELKCTGRIILTNATDINFGLANAGNVCFNYVSIQPIRSSFPSPFIINFTANNFGVGSDGKTVYSELDRWYLDVTTDTSDPSGDLSTFDLNFTDNLFSSYRPDHSGLTVFEIAGNVSFKHNFFGIDRSGTIPLNMQVSNPGQGVGITLKNVSGNVVIGDNDPALGNKFAYSYNGVYATNAPEVKLIRNSFKCMTGAEYINTSPRPQISVTANTGQYIEGATEANAIVDVYLSDDCTNCSPETYLGTTNADASGNWRYTFGQPYARSILANAHAGNRSSYFTKPEINISKLRVINSDCGHTGSITGLSISNTEKLKWLDESGNIVSTELELKDAKPGRYKLVIGEFCTVESEYLTIYDGNPKIDDQGLQISRPTCGQSNGSISNLYAATEDLQPLTYEWRDQDQNLVGNTLNISGLPPGSYTLTVKTPAGCSATYGPVKLTNSIGPDVDQTNRTITPSGCSQPSGSITGIVVTGVGTITYSWKNSQNVEVSTTADVTGQPPGDYILTVSDGTSCGNITVAAIKIPLLNEITINISGKTIQDATCDNYDGSIKNVTVTGTGLTYSWKNDKGVQFGTQLDLEGAPAGVYTLTVTGQSYCSPVTSEAITIQSLNGVSLDYSGQGGRSATCNESNGAITGLKASGATTYQWVTTGTNAIVGSQIDLKDVPAGFYTLTISNAVCSKSYDFEVAGFPPTVFTGITHTSTKTCAAFASGTITLNTDNANEQPMKYRWVNSAGDNVGFDKTVQFLPAGNYRVYLTDKNFCENPLPETFTIEAYPEFNVTRFGTITNTQCGVGYGAVSASTVTGGTGNYSYQWLNADDNDNPIAGKTQSLIDNVLPGHYKLRITDGGCSLAEIPFTIIDEAVTPPTPSADNIQVYNTGKAIIKINSPFPTAIYRLYETADGPQPIKDTIGGDITINVTESRSYYVSLTYGYCESARAEIKVSLSAISGAIPNTFTPNGDGINDYWNIRGLDTYPNATVNIFNRYGQAVYQSAGYAKPFDGTSKGKQLPAGVYYYIINLKRGDVLSGSVTILR